MSFIFILPYYLRWHYSTAFSDIKNLWKNLVLFVYNFFSIPILVSTLFSPWERIQDGYGKDMRGIFETFIFNTIMRVIGVVVRLTFIIIGIFCIFIAVCLSLITYIAWLFLPIIIIVSLVFGIKEFSV